MRTRLGVGAFLVWLAISGLPAAEIPDEVHKVIDRRIRSGFDKGMVIGILDGEKQTIVGFGSTEAGGKQKPDRSTVFEIGSVTKVFTGILLARMSLAEEVRLDQAVSSLVPENVKIQDERVAAITLAQLASHSSGLPRMPGNFAPKDGGNPYGDYDADRMLDFLASYELAAEGEPGYTYSNYGAGLLGHLLARRAGSSFEELVRDRITGPLKMSETALELSPELAERLAPGYSGAVEASNWTFTSLAGAGGLRSTAPDLLRFLSAVTSKSAGDLTPAIELSLKPIREAGTPVMQVGLGWHIRKSGDLRIPWHSGGTGGYRSFIGFIEGTRRAVVVLSNSDHEVSDIGLHLLDSSFPLDRTHEMVAEVDQATLESYAGKYQLGFMYFDVEARPGVLVAKITGQGWATLYPESRSRFFYSIVNAQIRFNRDEDGQVDSLTLYQNGMEQRATRIGKQDP